jgi:spermidine/putrescine transport system substrate-binding protein
VAEDLNELLQRMAKAKVNRRGFMAAAGYSSLAAFLAACAGQQPSSSAPVSTPAGATPAPSGSASAAPTTVTTEGALFMYNWADYVDLDNIEEFKKRYNVSDFTYDTFASNDELLTKLQGGATGQYDVGAPTAEFVPGMVEQGFLQKIDWSKIPNQQYINPQFKKLWWDPNDEYQLPKDWGTTGISIRTKVVKEEVKTWKQFFEVAPKYSGRIVVVDSPGDVFVAPLKALGFSLNSTKEAELEQARKLLLDLAPHVLALDSDTYDAKLRTEEAVLGLTWTGGVAELRDEPDTADTVYQIPEDGTLYWMDTWVIFADPPHPEAAHAFLNFIHEPDIQARETVTNRYATPNDEAKKLVPKEILDDPTVFVPQSVFDSGLLEGAQDLSRDPIRIDIWEEFKSKIGG